MRKARITKKRLYSEESKRRRGSGITKEGQGAENHKKQKSDREK
jgi:hypothetical protein